MPTSKTGPATVCEVFGISRGLFSTRQLGDASRLDDRAARRRLLAKVLQASQALVVVHAANWAQSGAHEPLELSVTARFVRRCSVSRSSRGTFETSRADATQKLLLGGGFFSFSHAAVEAKRKSRENQRSGRGAPNDSVGTKP